ncbi:LysR family transcriptional regulator [Catenulispora pinisilvae]|uniref:LysR family transcriptional regulator n=1 Tax=Catenulispora pinisilvae TaxID=2705253 RepID=UPI00189214BE|nr:LysR family transcriptional regulator [Catenulispora pinisilvae]
MNDLETRQLRYFVAVAEELNFGRAAERLGMAQPPLSRAIRELERQLGVVLLERTTRRVELTASGQTLLRDARIALDAVTAAGRRAQHAGEARPQLRVALKADVDGGLLPRILEEYAAQETGHPATLVLGRYGEQATTLRDGRADVGLLLLDAADARGLDSEPLLTEPFLLAVAADDPLATYSEVCLADLGGRTMPDGKLADQGPLSGEECGFVPGERWQRTASGYWSAAGGLGTSGAMGVSGTLGSLGASGASAASDLPEIFRLIELGTIVCYFPASLTHRYPRPDIVYLPVNDLPPATLAVAWPQDSHSTAVAAFVRAATAVAAAAALV